MKTYNKKLKKMRERERERERESIFKSKNLEMNGEKVFSEESEKLGGGGGKKHALLGK